MTESEIEIGEKRERMRENDTEDNINLRGERGKREILTEQYGERITKMPLMAIIHSQNLKRWIDSVTPLLGLMSLHLRQPCHRPLRNINRHERHDVLSPWFPVLIKGPLLVLLETE